MQVSINLTRRKVKDIKSDFVSIGEISNIDRKKIELMEIESIDDWCNFLVELQGFYAILGSNNNGFFAAVDHTRSIPLFYGVEDEVLYISNEAEWIRKKLNQQVFDPIAKEEFQMLGYVLGNRTLYSSVKQLKAGECLTIIGGKLELKQYYSFKHIEPSSFNKDKFYNQLNASAQNSIHRLIDYAAGRQIIVPLSGGYDSRLIVSLLKEAGYDNVICYSYGVSENSESIASHKIAHALNYDWLFVEYTDTFWKEAWASNEAEEFREFASNYTSLPHIQDWLALQKLKDNPVIKPDAVFAPGHCCVTGYIPPDIYDKKINNNYFCKNIIKTHFNGRPFSLNRTLNIEMVKKTLCDNKQIESINDAASEIMRFNWQERQAKYITNSVRVYEQFDFDWWLPLWDQEFMMPWEEVPLRYRLNRSLYINYVDTIFDSVKEVDVFNSKDTTFNADNINVFLKKTTKKIINKLLPDPLYDHLTDKLKKKLNKTSYNNHFLKFESLMSSDDMNYYIENNYTIIGMYSDLFLKRKWGKY